MPPVRGLLGLKGSTGCQGLSFSTDAEPVFDQPALGAGIEPSNSQGNPGIDFFVTAIRIDNHPERIVGVRDHRDFEVNGLLPHGRLQNSDHDSFLSKRGEMAESSVSAIILADARSLQAV